VQIEPGLRLQSPENGNISNIGRRLSAIPSRRWPNSEPGDRLPIRKSPPLAAFLPVSGTLCLSAALPGWRRSADRTRLRMNSLLTGNFAISGLRQPIQMQKTALLRPLSEQFPVQISRENICMKGVIFRRNREIVQPSASLQKSHHRRRKTTLETGKSVIRPRGYAVSSLPPCAPLTGQETGKWPYSSRRQACRASDWEP
jgi:hypothetical protein